MSEITQLPIYQHQSEINDALSKHQVIVVEGPTGCGKTTQLPRILLRNPQITGKIGLTQPRRIAAVSVASRIAKEIGVELGQEVGYAIRFDDKTSPSTLVKVMTDGILLQESRSDHLYSEYQVIIIDEAHERSLNIDLALGLLKLALDKRPDLRVIISSATIEPVQFQRFFSDNGKRNVPLISIKSRTFPVEISYKALNKGGRRELPETLVSEVKRIHRSGDDGHILAFLPGQAAIMDCAELLQEAMNTDRSFRNLWVLPLYGQLPREEQERVFDEEPGKRKVVLSTNIAETSITIPNVRFVIDSGIAKIPRYMKQSHILVLKEEPISMASLAQRAGRAGRTAAGEAVRLFDESLLNERVEFTDEEITRLDLSEVLLRLIDLGIHDIEHFPFPTEPPRQAIHEALATLRRMDAIDDRNFLTSIGEKMTPFPLLPTLARVVVEAAYHFPSVLHEVILACSYLSVKSPFLFPPGKEIQAKKAHAKLASAKGDLITAVHTIREYEKTSDKELFCRKNYLESDTMAFILKSYHQLNEIAQELGFIAMDCEDENDLIRAFLSAFGEQVLQRKGRSYVTQTGETMSLHPSSTLYEIMPRLIMAIEFVQSSRIYAQQASTLRSNWLEERGIRLESPARHGEQRFDADRKKARRRERFVVDEKARKDISSKESRSSTPSLVSICGETFKCSTTPKGITQVLIPLKSVEKLKYCNREDIPKDIRRYKASLRDNQLKEPILRNYSLDVLIEMLKVLPLPSGEIETSTSIPLGASLEGGRNIATITKHLPQLLTCMVPPHRFSPGWLSLASSDELFWFELSNDVSEALVISLQALLGLSHFAKEDKHKRIIEAQLERLSKLDSKLRKSW